MKKLMSMMLIMALLFTGAGRTVLAEETVYPMGFLNVTSDEDSSVAEWLAAARGTYLSCGSCSITRQNSTQITISGNTTAHQTCDQVELWLFVEFSRSYATGYSTYWDNKYTEQNVYKVTREISNITVEEGYYYRTRAVHVVTHNGVREVNDSVTDPIKY
ncbi:MAG: DUF6147 family protein [Lachnospiraceae bacterium]